jgi:hypothetical protein
VRSPGGALVAAVVVCAAVLCAEPAAAAPAYGSNGVFGVTTNPRPGWTTTSIPPGHYRVDQSPSMYPYLSPPGFWLRCREFPCTPTSPGNITGNGDAVRDAPTFMDILPGDVAVSLHNVTLTPA